MVFGFGRKKREEAPFPSDMPSQPALGPPTDMVISMRQQGLTNNQIVQMLQRDGYNSDQIFDAMSQADIKSGVQEIPPPAGMPQFAPPAELPQSREPAAGSDAERAEEMIEAIIEEKWSELKADIGKIVEWKAKTEARIGAVEEKVAQVQRSFDELNKAMIGKMNEYDRHVSEVGTGIRAMENVFQKVLPTFTQNVNELSRLVRGTKKKKP